MMYGLLADLLVVVHAAIVAFVVSGFLLIPLGWAFDWQWVRNRWYRAAHLLAIVVVAGQSLFGMHCPLTTWEYNLRVAAGEPASEASFIARLLNALLFDTVPAWALHASYYALAALAVALLALVRPRWRTSQCPRREAAS